MNNGYISANASHFPGQPVELLSDNSECVVSVSLSGGVDGHARTPVNSPGGDHRLPVGLKAVIAGVESGPLTPLTHDIGSSPPLCVDLVAMLPPKCRHRSISPKADTSVRWGRVYPGGTDGVASRDQFNMVESPSAIRAGTQR